MSISKPKLIVILGPTASGKSDLAVKLAKKLALSKVEGFNGAEIVSADSRQVYKGMNIGSGKITKKEMAGIAHYLLDVAWPKRRFTVAQYKKLALRAIQKIQQKGKLPILCGGTGFYIQAVVDGISIPAVPPDQKLRAKLEKLSTTQLYQKLKKLDPQRAKTIEKNNRRRLIRALEIVLKTGQPVPPLKRKVLFDILIIGLKKSPTELKKFIKKRLLKRLKQGMISEVKKLKKAGLSWLRLDEFGLEYRWIARYLQKKITYSEMVEKIQKESEQYAKRQMTWFKRHPAPEQVRCGASTRIHWIKNQKQAERLLKAFLSS